MENVLFIRFSLNRKENNNGIGWQSFEQIRDYSLIAEKSLIKKSYIYIILLAMISPFYMDNGSLLIYATAVTTCVILMHLMALIIMAYEEPPISKQSESRERFFDTLNSMVLTSGIIYSAILSMFSIVVIFKQAGDGHIDGYGMLHVMLSISMISILLYLVEIASKSEAMLMARRYLKPMDSDCAAEIKKTGCKDTVDYINGIGSRPLLSGECILLLSNQSEKKELIINIDWLSGSLVESMKALPFK